MPLPFLTISLRMIQPGLLLVLTLDGADDGVRGA